MREDIGSCVKTDIGWVIDKQWYGQGNIFKSWDAFENRPNDPCYVPELSDNRYTYNDFMEICNYQKDRAKQLFEILDWQDPNSEIDCLFTDGLWGECREHGIVDLPDGDNGVCPICGKELIP